MAIVHMDKRVDSFLSQLENEAETFKAELQFFDYDDKLEVNRFDEEVVLSLRDFDIDFILVIEQTGVYTPEDYCQPSEFSEISSTTEISDLQVYDNIYGEYLRFNREEFTEIVQLVKNLIII